MFAKLGHVSDQAHSENLAHLYIKKYQILSKNK